MKWQIKNIKDYIKHPDPAIKAFFIHGDNEGYVSEIEKSLALCIADLNDSFSVDNFTGKDLSEENFFAALSTMSLMMNRRVIRINGIRKGMDEMIKKMLVEYTGDTLVLIKSGRVDKKNAIYKLFESNPDLVMVACFDADVGYMKNMIAEEVRKCGKIIDDNVINWLIRNNDKDYLVAKSELEKLITYAWDKEKITIEDVLAVAEENTEVNSQKLINAVLNGDLPRIGPILFELFAAENSPVSVVMMITRTLSNYVCELKMAKELISEGKDENNVLRTVCHVPFLAHPQTQMTRRFINLWSYEKLDMISKEMLNLEKISRDQYMPIEIIAERSMYKIACLKTNS